MNKEQMNDLDPKDNKYYLAHAVDEKGNNCLAFKREYEGVEYILLMWRDGGYAVYDMEQNQIKDVEIWYNVHKHIFPRDEFFKLDKSS
jgi:hypothetical protein